jgi:plasmid stabilization system protein ParE
MSFASRAMAQDAFSEARAALDEARFADAVSLYDQAAAARQGLDRGSLVRLFRERALARGALRDIEGAREDLLALFSLDPSAHLGDEAPPSLARLAEEVRASVRGPLAVTAEASATGDGYEVSARVERDPASIVREIRIIELLDGGVETHAGPVVRIESDLELRYVVEAISYGGAVVASLGTPTEPRTLRREDVAAAEIAQTGDDSGAWIGLGVVAGVVVVAVAVTLALIFTLPSGNTQVGFPMELE